MFPFTDFMNAEICRKTLRRDASIRVLVGTDASICTNFTFDMGWGGKKLLHRS
jgi:hypothetical protein